ncbi:asparagine synthase (glutamine-hydrolyzing) [Candidatus Pelagibacter sp. HIMB1587]|uniref:asparagine synthase (glutamine-hydrolyzing) n=1 Tax=Candidatus Pelagibacter sp. HIMB1587 TaxID=3413354 RepID=UPI003F842A0D
MCGIAGFYSKNLSSFDKIIFEMTSAIYHRGPDDINFWKDENSGIAFGHQRLSILDLSVAGSQPMKSNSGRFIITYNGEIYNHIEIRKELKKINSNITWNSNSDTETLLEASEFWGVEKTLEKIAGMFAFSIWDKKNRTLYLARDRIGEKPLYFGWQGNGINKSFIFGSELKALKNHPEFSKQINRRAIALQLQHNYIPDPYSIYKDIYKLLPGHYLKLTENDLIKNRLPNPKIYWSSIKKAIDGSNNKLKSSEDKIKSDLENKLKLSVKQKMISDVPLGAFLSGGIDSTTIVALMQSQSNRPVKTFTIGFKEDDFNEAKYAKKIAKHLGTDHTELYFSSDTAIEVIPKIPIIYDEPFSDNSQIPSFILSQFAKKNVKVALSGDGGDELFCGYNRYISTYNLSKYLDYIPLSLKKALAFTAKKLPKDTDKLIKLIPGVNKNTNFRRKILKSANALEANNISELYYLLFSQWQNLNEVLINNDEPENFFSKSKIELSKLNDFEKMMLIDQTTYLPNNILVKIDRASMSSSLETRVPFLDHELIEYVWKIPQELKFKNSEGKWILKQILNKYVPKNLTNRPKKGFGIPLDTWLRGPLKDWAENLLDEKRLLQEGYFNPKLIRNKWREHLTNKNNWEYDLWNILMFQAWLDANN